MNRDNIFLIICLAIFLSLAGWKFYSYMVIKDFLVTGEISCDPSNEVCFARECDGADCTSEYEYYKKISKNNHSLITCPANSLECDFLKCNSGEKDCIISICNSDTKTVDELCSDEISTSTDIMATGTENI